MIPYATRIAIMTNSKKPMLERFFSPPAERPANTKRTEVEEASPPKKPKAPEWYRDQENLKGAYVKYHLPLGFGPDHAFYKYSSYRKRYELMLRETKK